MKTFKTFQIKRTICERTLNIKQKNKREMRLFFYF